MANTVIGNFVMGNSVMGNSIEDSTIINYFIEGTFIIVEGNTIIVVITSDSGRNSLKKDSTKSVQDKLINTFFDDFRIIINIQLFYYQR